MTKLQDQFLFLALMVLVVLCPPAFAGPEVIANTPNNRIADEVLQRLLSSPLGKLAPHLHYHASLIESRYANAFSDYEGNVSITDGLFPVLDDDPGVWAAVIGHELGHVILRHPKCLPRFEAALRQAYEQARARGYQDGPPQWPEVRLGEGISGFRFSREVELQADFIGLMLMAGAGYQPGFALLLDQRLRYGLGDMPGVMDAIFSRHPRLETREEHTTEFYGIAMDIFRSRWPDVARSPGGNLPPYGAIGRWTLQRPARSKLLIFQVPFQVHDAAGMQVRIAAFFLNKDMRVRASDAKYRASDGSLVLNAFVPGAASKSGQVTLSVAITALDTTEHKLLAVVFLMTGTRVLDISKQPVVLSGD